MPGGASRGNAGPQDDNAMQQVLSRMPAWQPDPAQEDKLGDETSLDDRYSFRLPKGFGPAAPAASETGQSFVRQKEMKPDESGGLIMVNIREAPQGVVFLSLGQAVNNAWNTLSNNPKFKDLDQGERQQGRIGDCLATRIYITAKRTSDQKKVKGVLLCCHDKEKVLILTAIFPEDSTPAEFAAAEAALLTIHRK
jgi:hypothetical protein